MKAGIIKTSNKENEKRIPIFPEHIRYINSNILCNLIFEVGYGIEYGLTDSYLGNLGCIFASRDKIFKECELLILPKPVEDDLKMMHEGQILWGWPHCVQQTQIAQIAIERRLTYIAWESMHIWGPKGDKLFHCFYKNNELAGYAAVLHMLELLGIDGLFGPRRKVVITGYGSVSKGAILALQGRGFNNIHVYSRRPVYKIGDQNPDVYFHQLDSIDGKLYVNDFDNPLSPFIDVLAKADIIVNGILQDTDDPIMFVGDCELDRLNDGTLIIDISCDEGMGFSFARPTSFENPIFKVRNNITYYSVDHTPSYLWNAASRELSKIVIPFLPILLGGKESWNENVTVRNSIEILDGNILNPKIISFQRRNALFPYSFK